MIFMRGEGHRLREKDRNEKRRAEGMERYRDEGRKLERWEDGRRGRGNNREEC